MRIRAIRGRNLASLAGDFAVDFGAEPLASAGVFAISGPTGAGKSTLLDAMCLALYHETPRLKAAQELNVSIPDVHDQSITPRDPRNLLRRGCGEGWAEVEFADRSGVAWRARWSVARARGKPDGRLQPATAELVRCEDQQRFDGKLSDIQARLVELTGLSFEQFCRSVLLAQNEFAALLKARQNERADLLEALTGTEIFQRLSTLAHERHGDEQRTLQALEQDLKLILPLDDDARAQLQQRVTAAHEGAATRRGELVALQSEQAWHAEGVRLAQRLAAGEAEHARLQADLDANAGLRRQLQRWAAVAPLRPLLDGGRQAAREHQACLLERAALDKLVAAADAARAAAVSAWERATLAATQAVQRRDAARPQIVAARAADAAIREVEAALAAARIECAQAAAQVDAIGQQIDERQARHRLLQQARQSWIDWQSAHPALATVADAWSALGPRLDAAVQLQLRLLRVQRRRDDLHAEVESAQAGVDCAVVALDQARVAADAAATTWQQQQRALADIDAAALDRSRDALIARERGVQQLQVALQSTLDSTAREGRLAHAFAAAQGRLQPLGGALARAEATRIDAARESASATLTFERASLLAHAHTERLRELLVAGEPCPLCGSREHPQAHPTDADARGLLDLLGADAAHARQQLDTAIADVAARTSELAAGERELETTALALREAVADLDCVRSNLLDAAAPWLPQADSVDAITAALPALSADLAGCSASLQQARAQWTAARAAAESAALAAQSAQQQREALRERLAALQAALAPQRAALDSTEGERQALASELDGLCHAIRQVPGLGATRLDELALLQADWAAGDGVRLGAMHAAEAQRDLDVERLHLLDARSAAQTTRERRQQTLEGLDQALHAARTDRQDVLGEPDVEAYAQRLDGEADAAIGARELAQRQHHDAELTLQRRQAEQLRCQQQADDRLRQQLASEQQLQLRLEDLSAALGADGATAAELHGEIEHCPGDLAARLAMWAERERISAATLTQIVAIGAELDDWRASARSLQSRDAVDAALVLADHAYAQAQRELGALQAELGGDDLRRQQSAEQMAALQARREAARRWRLLDELIGARDGARFKRYAQQFTLEVLIEYANEHLARLARRYRLRRGNEPLSLLVIDSDLADEVRSVHSLSGGETFLVSLALALGLASLSSQRLRVESLFIDEGFGSLDADTLNTAMEALDRLQAEGRRVGVISHVHDMAERIGVQVRVEPLGAGRSRVVVIGQS